MEIIWICEVFGCAFIDFGWDVAFTLSSIIVLYNKIVTCQKTKIQSRPNLENRAFLTCYPSLLDILYFSFY